MSGHRYGVVVRPVSRLLSMHIMHANAQLRQAAPLEARLREESASKEELELAGTLIDAADGPVDWAQYRDDAAAQLEKLVEAKIQGRPLDAPQEEPAQVLQLLEALQQSVAAADANDSGSVSCAKGRRSRRSSRPRSA